MSYRVKREVSSGGVIVRHDGRELRVCLIMRRLEQGGVVWGLPKGHVEPGEEIEATALREVREETGLIGDVLKPLGAIAYQFVVKKDRTRFYKTVHFFLMRYVSGDTGGHDHEVEDAVWLPLEQALKQASYPNERRMLVKAKKVLHELSLTPDDSSARHGAGPPDGVGRAPLADR